MLTSNVLFQMRDLILTMNERISNLEEQLLETTMSDGEDEQAWVLDFWTLYICVFVITHLLY